MMAIKRMHIFSMYFTAVLGRFWGRFRGRFRGGSARFRAVPLNSLVDASHKTQENAETVRRFRNPQFPLLKF